MKWIAKIAAVLDSFGSTTPRLDGVADIGDAATAVVGVRAHVAERILLGGASWLSATVRRTMGDRRLSADAVREDAIGHVQQLVSALAKSSVEALVVAAEQRQQLGVALDAQRAKEARRLIDRTDAKELRDRLALKPVDRQRASIEAALRGENEQLFDALLGASAAIRADVLADAGLPLDALDRAAPLEDFANDRQRETLSNLAQLEAVARHGVTCLDMIVRELRASGDDDAAALAADVRGLIARADAGELTVGHFDVRDLPRIGDEHLADDPAEPEPEPEPEHAA